jgi:hypothetical protein
MTTERQVAQFRSQLSRIIRQVRLIEQGNYRTKKGEKRLDIIIACATDVDEQCKTLNASSV